MNVIWFIMKSSAPQNKGKDPPLTVSAVITAAGTGSRMGLEGNKIFLEIERRPVLIWTLERICSTPNLNEIILVCNTSDQEMVKGLLAKHRVECPTTVIAGGPRRQDSMAHGARATRGDSGYLLLHDAVRPFVTPSRLHAVCQAAFSSGAALLTSPVTCTVKRKTGEFVETIDRSNLYLAQTPQVIERGSYLRALELMYREGWEVTDDISLMERLGHPVVCVEGDSYNMKITYPGDLAYAAFVHQKFFSEPCGDPPCA
jgi:2-C-methyl-D-erythritol 4-phosphate cytidylyltransferase